MRTFREIYQDLKNFPDKPDKYTRLLSDAEAKFALEEMSKRAHSREYQKCSKDMAKGYAVSLVRFFPNKFDVGDLKVFTTAMAAIFATYPEKWVKELCEPVTGIAVKTEKPLVSLKDVKDALEEKREHAVRAQTAAVASMEERKRREQEAEMERLNAITPEQRRATVAETWGKAKEEMQAAANALKIKEMQARIAQDEARGMLSAGQAAEFLASLKRRLAMLERDPQTVLSSDDLVTPARPPSEELKAKARAPLNNSGERWQ